MNLQPLATGAQTDIPTQTGRIPLSDALVIATTEVRTLGLIEAKAPTRHLLEGWSRPFDTRLQSECQACQAPSQATGMHQLSVSTAVDLGSPCMKILRDDPMKLPKHGPSPCSKKSAVPATSFLRRRARQPPCQD